MGSVVALATILQCKRGPAPCFERHPIRLHDGSALSCFGLYLRCSPPSPCAAALCLYYQLIRSLFRLLS